MSSDHQSNILSVLVVEILTQAALRPEFAFLGKSPSEARERFIGIVPGENTAVAQIASDGMNLDQKSALEVLLQKELAQHGLSATVYYKRRHSFADRMTLPDNGPTQPPPNRPGAFGVKMQLKPIPGVKKVIAVSSGKGGVGKSTVSVNLAAGLAAQGQAVGLLDADLYGPSAPLMMGIHGPISISADQKMIPHEKHGVKVMSFGFMSDPYHPVIWRGPMIAKALEQLFYQTVWGELDYLIIDLPPGTGDVQLTLIENVPLHGGIVVSTPQAVALLDAHKGLSMFEKLKVPVLGLVENMSHFRCSSCGHLDDIFGQAQIEAFAEERKIPIIGRIPLHRRIREASDGGIPVINLDPEFALYYMPIIEAVLRG
ncbi:MAG TPA: Mrp/NBP35 family ATP-binding protein [Oligoflexus sp.]|uniref:Mrp/NBP35 family ATP-binding protein n=1 Tax=Oligoflexus sp. TaxID=1971216 RepID=UPI002D67A2A4|nr:Mrp/NBP35 family ATP-binding protein [Oligoflexus sp.]HYX39857.1 Mrp/NBP35 family ATP-binding protein [Oligoflexus sp.]